MKCSRISPPGKQAQKGSGERRDARTAGERLSRRTRPRGRAHMLLALGLPAPLAVSAPPHTSVSSAASSSRDLDPRLRLAAPIGSSGRATCPDGQRSAREDECVAAVQEVAHALQLSVRDGLKVVDEGAKGLVPSGCSYSRHSKQALFNKSPAGGSGATTCCGRQ